MPDENKINLENEIRDILGNLDAYAGLTLELIENTENTTLQNIEEICTSLQEMITQYQEEKGHI